jgi:hypothetical protein
MPAYTASAEPVSTWRFLLQLLALPLGFALATFLLVVLYVELRLARHRRLIRRTVPMPEERSERPAA